MYLPKHVYAYGDLELPKSLGDRVLLYLSGRKATTYETISNFGNGYSYNI